MNQISPGDYVAYLDENDIERTARAVQGPAVVAGEPVVWIRYRNRGRVEIAAFSVHLIRSLPAVKPRRKTAKAANAA